MRWHCWRGKVNEMIKVYGASDDLIEIEGDIREEFSFYSRDKESRLLAFSDGTLLRIIYDDDGIWRISLIARGRSDFSKQEGSVPEDTNDIVTLAGETISWVVLGEQSAIKKQ